MAQSEIRGLREFQAEMREFASKAFDSVDSVFVETASDLRDEYRADARSSKHFFKIADTISYDHKFTGLGSLAVEVGPRDEGQGNLAAIAYFGGGRHGGGGTLDLDGPFTKWGAVLDRRLNNLWGWL